VATDPLEPGLYAELLTNRVAALLQSSTSDGQPVTAPLRDADAAERLSRYIGAIVAEAVLALDEDKRAAGGLDIVTSLLRRLDEHSPAGRLPDDQLAEPARMLEAIRFPLPDGTFAPVVLPLTPLLDTTVLTSARGEPTVQHELIAEIPSALRIDMLIAFVRWSGVHPLLATLRRHLENGGRIRLLTTTYTNSTEARALDELAAIGAEVKVSYDTTTTRLHANALAVPQTPWDDDGVYRLVKPYSQCPRHRPRVECAGLGSPQPRCGRQDGRGIRVVLGEWRFRALRLGHLSTAHAGRGRFWI